MTQGSDVHSDVVDLRQLIREREVEFRAMAERVERVDFWYRDYVRDIATEILMAVAAMDHGDHDAARERLMETCSRMRTITGPLTAPSKH